MEKPIWILGHRNPDTDAICAALAYAELKQALGVAGARAGRVGPLNRETAFVLGYFGVEPPPFVADVRPRVADMLRREIISCAPETTLQEAGRLMREHQVKTLPVVDPRGRLLGLFTTGDLAHHLLVELGLEALAGSASRAREILATPVRNLMKTEGIVSFHEDELADQVKRVMLETRFRNYPVVDEQDRLLGMVARYDLLALRRKQVILVDHNERAQAVPGIEQAEVLEIIDHHRLGDVQTGEPLYFRSEPVGSTCTIIGKIYQEQGVEPSPRVAGLLCAGILSDTVIFKSPTCTPQDRDIARYLSRLAGLEPEPFGIEIFRAGSALAERPAREILNEDFKDFELGDLKVGIGQVEAIGTAGLEDVKEALLEEMDEMARERGYDLVLMMLTDIAQEGTELLVAGPGEKFAAEAFGQEVRNHRIFLPGVMSRKKQVVPPLARLAALR
ncbi:MAG: putative manganese-dependent inorganic diphosphatase [Firmicutes bacterium]|nr:putative manganese-dependent inorganic diphosphatase [Bacillota bacterium]